MDFQTNTHTYQGFSYIKYHNTYIIYIGRCGLILFTVNSVDFTCHSVTIAGYRSKVMHILQNNNNNNH